MARQRVNRLDRDGQVVRPKRKKKKGKKRKRKVAIGTQGRKAYIKAVNDILLRKIGRRGTVPDNKWYLKFTV